MKRNFLRIVFALTLPLGLFWSLGVFLDAPISQGLGWGPFFVLCAAASLAFTIGVASFVPGWLSLAGETSARSILVWLLLGSVVSYVSLAFLLALLLALMTPADEHTGLIALWLPLWWMLPLGALATSRMARRPTRPCS